MAAEPTPEAKGNAATPAVEGAIPPDNTPVIGTCSGTTANYIGQSGAQDAIAAAQEQAAPAGCPTAEAPTGAAPTPMLCPLLPLKVKLWPNRLKVRRLQPSLLKVRKPQA